MAIIKARNYTEKDNEIINRILRPLNLHSRLNKAMKEPNSSRSLISVKQLVPNTLKIGTQFQQAFDDLSEHFCLTACTYQAKAGEDPDRFLSNAAIQEDDFVLLQIHGKDTEERLLEPVVRTNLSGRLIAYIHRPEELILRIALEENVSYTAAKSLLHTRMRTIEAVILSGACFIPEYHALFPEKIVSAIPLGFTNPGTHVDLSKRLAPNAVVCIGSDTTWGEMRYVEDLISLLKSIKNHDRSVKVMGYAMGKFDYHATLEQYIGHPDILFLSNDAISKAQVRGFFNEETEFREWLFKTAGERLIIRATVEDNRVIPEFFSESDNNLFTWENTVLDFNVQMYHELLDEKREISKRGLPKIEYSGTLHKGSKHMLFVVFESMSMLDVQINEGFSMIKVPFGNGLADFSSASTEIISLIKNPTKRRQMMEDNDITKNKLGMKEVAYAFYRLMEFLNNTK